MAWEGGFVFNFVVTFLGSLACGLISSLTWDLASSNFRFSWLVGDLMAQFHCTEHLLIVLVVRAFLYLPSHEIWCDEWEGAWCDSRTGFICIRDREVNACTEFQLLIAVVWFYSIIFLFFCILLLIYSFPFFWIYHLLFDLFVLAFARWNQWTTSYHFLRIEYGFISYFESRIWGLCSFQVQFLCSFSDTWVFVCIFLIIWDLCEYNMVFCEYNMGPLFQVQFLLFSSLLGLPGISKWYMVIWLRSINS